MTPIIEVDDLQLRYGETTALDGVSFALAPDRIYGLLGRNGSGKTSLLSVLAAFRRATAGTVRVAGEPVFENRRATRQICLIRESGDAGERGDSVADTLVIASRLRARWDAGYAEKLMELFQLPRAKKLGQLSRGQRSALGVLLGLASRAPVTMFDESHLGMDAPSRRAFQDELLADFTAHPRTIVISTHLIEELAPLFEQVLILDRGRLVLHDDTDAVRARGAALTGPAEAVDRLVAGRTTLGERVLGRTKSAMLYGEPDEELFGQARQAGVEVGPVPLQELFIHLTEPRGEAS